MPSNLFIEPDTGADIPASSGTLGLGAESGLKRDQTPLQSKSCYIVGGSSIYICFIATSTFKQPSLSVEENPVSLGSVSAFRTSLRCLCGGNFNDINAMLPCDGLNCHPELCKWNAMYLPVCSLRLLSISVPLSEVLKPLNGNRSIVFHRNLNDFMCNLPYPRVDEISFIMLHPAESTPCSTASLVCVTPKRTSTLHELPLLLPYILSKIKLFQNSSITSQNRNSKTTTVDINSYNCLILLLDLKLLSEESDDNITTILPMQSELSTSPAIVGVFNKSLISTILLDWQSNSAITIKRCNNDNRISTLCLGKLSRTRNVKPDWNLLKLLASLQILPDLMDTINEYLGMQTVFLLDNRIGGVM